MARVNKQQPYYWNTHIHVALLYAKMVGCPFTVDDLYEFSPIFKSGGNRYRVVNSLNRATKNGHLAWSGKDAWRITQLGIHHLHQMALLQRRLHPLSEEEMAEFSLD